MCCFSEQSHYCEKKKIKKIRVFMKIRHRNRYYTWRHMYIYEHISLSQFLEWEIFQTKVVEKTKTHVLCSVIFLNQNTFCVQELFSSKIKTHVSCSVTFFSFKNQNTRFVFSNVFKKSKHTFCVQELFKIKTHVWCSIFFFSKVKTHVLCSITFFFSKIVQFMR